MIDTREERAYETDPDARPVRSHDDRETTYTGAGAALALAAGTVARLIRLAAGVVAAIIVAGILLVVLNANPSNDVVSTVHDAASALVGPFDGMFTLDSADATLALNWGHRGARLSNPWRAGRSGDCAGRNRWTAAPQRSYDLTPHR